MSMINFKKYKEIEARPFRFGVEGLYTCRAIKPGFGVVRALEIPFNNIITDLGMNVMASSFNARFMHLGTGTTPPQFTDTQLANFGVGFSGFAAQEGVSGAAPHYGWSRLTWTSDVGAATGNWTEIGVSNQIGNGNLRSRALIQDSGGNPTAFPVQADEQFQGSYELRLYAPVADDSRSVDISGVPYDATSRALRVTNPIWQPVIYRDSPFFVITSQPNEVGMFSGGLAAVTANDPLGSRPTSPAATNRTSAAYIPDSFQRDISARWGSGAAVGTCRTAKMQLNAGMLQVEYDPTIDKLATEELIWNQRIVWARQ